MKNKIIGILFCLILPAAVQAQMNWVLDGNSYVSEENGTLVKVSMPGLSKTVLVSAAQLVLPGGSTPLKFSRYEFSKDLQKVLLFADPVRLYHNTFNSCWVYDLKTKKMQAVGKEMGSQLLNTKLSPDGKMAAFVYKNNIYVQDLQTEAVSQLTADGKERLLNGLFDYAYSEELFCVDGFRWSPDGRYIAYWQMDLSKVGTFYMINNTDSIYPKPIPIIFSKSGGAIAEAKIGVIALDTKKTQWMKVPGETSANYIPRMEWLPDGSQLIVQQLNRKQNESKLLLCNPADGSAKTIYTEKDEAWIDVKGFWMRGGNGWDWMDGGKSFIWATEKDGWRHLYSITLEGKETLLTKGDYDVTNFNGYDAKNKLVYFTASPENATQRYLFRVKADGAGPAEKVTPASLPGTHNYSLSSNGLWAQHNFSSHLYEPASEMLSLPSNKPLDKNKDMAGNLVPSAQGKKTSFFKITTEEGIEMDGWMVKPANFDPSKKYPVVFTVYSEPFAATVNDVANVGQRAGFFDVDSGYIFISVEGRGAPAPKGRAWRKAIYRNLGWLNPNDQAMAARQIIKWPFIDPSRVAVFGSSGGGSTTMHLLFRYPDLYQTGIASAGVPSHFVYNNIYTERFLGLLPENEADYAKGSALNYAKNLKGNLLLLHGTGDHNVPYQGEELLLNELIKYNRQFMFMPYPNRTHGISEGEGTREHKATLMANFLKLHCPPGGR